MLAARQNVRLITVPRNLAQWTIRLARHGHGSLHHLVPHHLRPPSSPENVKCQPSRCYQRATGFTPPRPSFSLPWLAKTIIRRQLICKQLFPSIMLSTNEHGRRCSNGKLAEEARHVVVSGWSPSRARQTKPVPRQGGRCYWGLFIVTRNYPVFLIYEIFSYSAPFDRHDWIVDRCGMRMRYVIDFYTGRNSSSGPSFYLDVRPALDNWEGVKMRVQHCWQRWMGVFAVPSSGSNK